MAKQDKEQKINWPSLKNYKNTIRLEFFLYITGIILVVMLTTGYVITNQFVETVSLNVIEKQLVQARSYAGSSGKLILSTNGPDELLLNNICKNLKNENKEAYWCGITDSTTTFIAHSDIKQVISGAYSPDIITGKFQNLLKTDEQVEVLKDSIRIRVPINANGISLGYLFMVSTTDEIQQAKFQSITTVSLITILMFLLGVPIVMFMLQKKLKPIKTITKNLQDMDYNKFDLDIPIKNKNEFGYLSETLNVMGVKLHQAQSEQIERERIAREYEIASDIQSKILPTSYPNSDIFEFSGTYKSAKEVGGDYYDFIEHDAEHLGFLIADVSGKSLPGMLIMLLTRDIIRNLSRRIKDPAHILALTNEQLLPSIKKGMFVTMFYGVLNKTVGTFEFASAGHNPLIHLDLEKGKSELIKTKGFPLGLMQPDIFNQRIEKGFLQLEKNNLLVQYTDGINEAKNIHDEEYGMDRFIKTIEKSKSKAPEILVEETIKSLDKFVNGHDQFDDITLLILKWENRLKENNLSYTKEGTNVY